MAARENQGLQIALIIFVMLTIILSVTTYIFFDNNKKAIGDAKAATEKAAKAESERAKITLENESFLALLNQPIAEAAVVRKIDELLSELNAAKDSHKNAIDIMTKNRDLLYKYSALAGQNTKIENFPELLIKQGDAVREKEGKLVAHKAAEEEAKQALASVKSKLEAEVAAAKAETTKSQGEYGVFSGTWKRDLAALGQSKIETEKKIEERVAENQALQDKVANITKKATVEIKGYVNTNKSLKDALDLYKDPRPTLTDGQIVYVDERTKSAYVNIGSADSLQRRVSFSVYDRGTNDVATAVKKGAIEIIDIIDDKLSRARIIENSVNDPILPGDFIDSTLWYPGKRLKLAIAGAIDFDKDGVSDRAKLKDIITANGGTVIADVTERAEVTGAITPDTEQVIVGRGPDERTDPKFQKAWNDMMADAKKYNVQIIPLPQFLDKVGYTANSQNSQDAGNQRLMDTKPKAKDNSGQIVPGFTPRTAPAGSGNSAFQK
jgi:hypothetical protein